MTCGDCTDVFVRVHVAGEPVDALIDALLPYLDKGGILIDGGNSLFWDTIHRTVYVEEKGFLYVGTGVSGAKRGH